MANRYTNLVGSKKISEDFNNINIGFDRVQAEMDTKGTPADAQAKADAAQAAAIDAAAAALTSHKQRGADEHPTAKGNAAGFMSAADKLKSDASTNAITPDTLMQRDAAGRAKVAAPAAADDIARKAETDAVQDNLESHAADTDIHVTADDHDKLDGIAAGAEVNQNAFAQVNNILASDPSDAMSVVGGLGITITTNLTTKELTVTATGDAAPGAHGSTHTEHGADPIPSATVTEGGLMSSADKSLQLAHTQELDGLNERFNTPERSAITLQPGVQVVQTDQDSAFKLSGLQGRTLCNLLGRDGNFEDASKWSVASCSLVLDNTSFLYGNSSGKAAATGTNSSGLIRSKTLIPVDSKKYYIAIVEIQNTSATSAYLRVMKPDFSATLKSSTPKTAKGSYLLHYVKLSPTDLTGLTNIAFDVVFPYVNTSSVINFDGGGVYEVDKALYDRIGVDITESNIRNYRPYVDSVQPVLNPYVIRYGANLLPPFYEWTKGNAFTMSDKYTGILKNTINDTIVIGIPFKIDVEYTYSAEHTGAIAINAWDNGGNLVGGQSLVPYTTNQSVTFKVPIGTVRLEAYFSNIVSDTQTLPEVSIKNPMLTIGTSAKPFKPREDSMLALQTDLFADPLTGTNADEVFERDGQYFKLAKWKRVVFDSQMTIGPVGNRTGFKVIYITSLNNATITGFVTSYLGESLKRLDQSGNITAAKQFAIDSPTVIALSIANTDSGWGDSYTDLTTDEIKAYFMGWVMTTQESWSTAPVPYNGTGTKGWVRRWVNASQGNPNTVGSIGTWVNNSATPTVPTTMSAGFTPYQLLYQLATPVVEPITSEGQLTFVEGANQVEVGTGIVLREGVKPYANAGIGMAGINAPSSPNYPGTGLKTKVSKLLKIYKDGRADNGWSFKPGGGFTGGGLEYADIGISQYNPSASYSVTYLMLDKYPAVDFAGTYAVNEKALLLDTVKSIQENTTRISVLESKKAEKDAPAWITPTLLNVWVGSGIGYRLEGARVFLKGSLLNGSITSGATLFMMPISLRPKSNTSFTLGQYSTATAATSVAIVDILTDGRVVLARAEHNVICFQGQSYSID